MTRDAATQRMIAEACLGARSEEEFAENLRGFLERHEVDAEDVEAMLDSPARLGVYRRLVRNNLVGVIAKMMPRARARANDLAARAFDRSLDAFLDEVGPRTHYLRDVPAEFLAFAAPRWQKEVTVPAYVPDLAAYELVEFAVGAAPVAADPPEPREIALDRPVLFAEALRLSRYDFAVHELSADASDRAAPPVRAVALLAYRDAAHLVRFLELTPLAAAVTERLLAGDPLGVAAAAACERAREPMSDSALATIARLLADYAERGIVLGAA